VVVVNKASLLAAGSSSWTVSSPISFSYSIEFDKTEPPPEIFGYPLAVNELFLSFGKVTVVGTARVSYRVLTPTTIEVGSVELVGGFDDLYDFAYGSGEKPRTAAKTQAGHATLSSTAFPSGKIFYVHLDYNTGFETVNKNY
jgi:hypothetical protein